MNQALNNFYVIRPYEQEDKVADAIYKYENSINVELWRGNTQLMLAEIVSADSNNEWVGSISGDTYANGDIIAFDPSCVIKHFDDGTKLVRDDAIICLFNEREDAPGANRNQVVLKIERNVGLELQNITNGFYGTVVDVQVDTKWNEGSKINNVKIGDKLILVNPYKTGTEMASYVFRKVSTTTGFYVIAEVDAIACNIGIEN